MYKLIVPKDWKVKYIEDTADITTGNKDTVNKEENGKYPFFVRSQTIERINSFSYDGEAILTAGDGVGVGKVFHYINGKFDFHQRVYKISDFKNVDGFFFYNYFKMNFMKQVKKYNAKTSVDSVRREMISKMEIPIPPITEQKKISSILLVWDKAIELKEQLIERKKEQKKGLMQKLLTGEVRLPGFEGKWNKEILENVATVIMGQSPPSSSYNEIQKGLPLIQGNADCENRKTYPKIWTSQPTKTCQIGDIIMTVRAPVGIVSRSFHGACIGRGVCAIRSNINQDFLYYQLISIEHRWSRISQGSTFESINSNDIKGLEIRVPSEEEQVAISKVLLKSDQELDLHERELIQLKQQKKGLMQLLLTGKVRVQV